jgi:hypothetical protein
MGVIDFRKVMTANSASAISSALDNVYFPSDFVGDLLLTPDCKAIQGDLQRLLVVKSQQDEAYG